MKIKNLITLIFLFTLSILAQQTGQTFLSLKDTGVEEFLQIHPEYDGRGTIIFILDTGVDIGVDGLVKTSAGDVKVIDVQDFTGEGDVLLFDADINEQDGKSFFVNKEKNYSVEANTSLMLKAASENYLIGAFPEKQLINSGSGSADLNGNGSTDDVYYLVAYETQDSFWAVYFDLNGNGNLSDEKPLRTYKENFDAFTIENKSGLPPFTMALNIFSDEKRVSLFFDDGSHGTHCCGIAAGYNIGGSTLNGVAPGANVIGLKIGHNNFPGGATVTESMKRAYLYADKISKERKEPCIVSMSFGIGSEIEGRSEMEMFLAELLTNNPYLYVSTSNGNNGPGLSSAGLPASSNFVFSSGAVLTTEVGRDNYGTTFDKNIILYFSSRGGEVSKPDIISPGACTSTVPNFSGGDKFWGTSMACPYSSGVMSLLLSAEQKEFPGIKIPSQLLFKIIREGAVEREEYSVLDQGAGYINVMNAYALLQKYLKNGEQNKFETYSITSFATTQPDNKSQNLYIRDGSYLTGDEIFSFTVKRNNFINSEKFYRTYNLKSDSDWLIPVQKKTYIRNNQPAIVNVKFDKNKMINPGVYTDRITAYRDDASATPEFTMIATVIIPEEFNSYNKYSLNWQNQNVNIGMVNRYFINIPAGQNSLHIKLNRIDKDYARIRYRLYDQNGIAQYLSPTMYSVNSDEVIESYHYDLTPGVYELIAEGLFNSSASTNYDLSAELLSIQTSGDKILSEKQNGIVVSNLFNEVKSYNLNGEIIGYKKSYSVDLNGSSNYRMPFTMRKGEQSREFNLILSKEDFNKVTDFSMVIYNEDEIAISKDGLSFSTGSVSVQNSQDKDNVNYVLEIIPAFTNSSGNMSINIDEVTNFIKAVFVDVKNNKNNSVTLFPNSSKTITCNFTKPENEIPADAQFFGKIYFKSIISAKTEYELPVYFTF